MRVQAFFYFCDMLHSSPQSKGRSSKHIQNRNHKLAARFYWYSVILGLNFTRCLEELEQEFDITSARICDLLAECGDIITELERNHITVQQLKNRYTFLNWSYNFNSSRQSPIVVQQSLPLF